MRNKRGLYRIFNSKSKTYISVVNGVVCCDRTISGTTAFVYDLQDVLQIKQAIIKSRRKIEEQSILLKPVLVPVNISEVRLSEKEKE